MYEYFDEKHVNDFSDSNIEILYDHGYVFTRLGKGVMHQVDSVRVDLNEFELSSENRRIIKKVKVLELIWESIPYKKYTWKTGRLAKDFYDHKGGEGTMSVNKIREMFTNMDKSNMNGVFVYQPESVGYCLCYRAENIIHYSYPFYNLNNNSPNIGMGMMLKAVLWAKEGGKKYIYLGSNKKYKHQFRGLEVFDIEKGWVISY